MIEMHSMERKLVNWPVSVLQAVALEVSFDDGLTWHPLSRLDDATATALVCGPRSDTNPAGTIVLNHGRNYPIIRRVDSPEVLVEPAGRIDVSYG